MQKRKSNLSSIPITDLEPHLGNEQVAKKKAKRPNSPASLHVHSIRKRLTDADGASAKGVIDGLVKAGIFEDDSPQFISQVSYSQEKAPKGTEEVTIITVRWG